MEFLYELVHARIRYEQETPRAQKRGDRNDLPALAHEVEDLVC